MTEPTQDATLHRLGGVVNLLPVDRINGYAEARLPGSSVLCGGREGGECLPGVLSS
jgi:hypothetical protein